MSSGPAVIAAYACTPMGGLLKDFASVNSTEFGAVAIRAAIERAGVADDAVDRVYMGCVLTAVLGSGLGASGGNNCGSPALCSIHHY